MEVRYWGWSGKGLEDRVKDSFLSGKLSFQARVFFFPREAWSFPRLLAGSYKLLCPDQQSRPLLTSWHCKDFGSLPQHLAESDFSELDVPPGMCEYFKSKSCKVSHSGLSSFHFKSSPSNFSKGFIFIVLKRKTTTVFPRK